jgi:hypothetical protein
MAFASGTRLGPYEIQSPLGAGGMGEVEPFWRREGDAQRAPSTRGFRVMGCNSGEREPPGEILSGSAPMMLA